MNKYTEHLTPEQKEYFKDSKVRDGNGDLLIVYHGSKTKGLNFLEWDPSRQTGGNFGEAYYFTNSYDCAKVYSYETKPENSKDPLVVEYYKEWNRLQELAKQYKAENKPDMELKALIAASKLEINGMTIDQYMTKHDRETEGEVLPMYLDLQNPLIKNAQGKNYYDVYPDYFKEARENGHDGIIVVNINDTALGTPKLTDVFIAFHQDQFKSIDNIGPTHGKEFRNEGLDNKILKCKTLSGQLQVVKHMKTMNAKLSEELENDMKQPNRFSPGHKFPKLSIGDDEI